MKSILSLLILLIATLGYGQESGTTLEEYRYLSKGYVYQLEMGLDAQKEGYSVKKLYTSSNKSELIALYENGTSQPRALLVIIDVEKKGPVYICIPNNLAGEKVRELAAADQKNISNTTQSNYQAAMNEFLFEALSKSKPDLIAFNSKKAPPLKKMQDERLTSRSANMTELMNEAPKMKAMEEPIEPMVEEPYSKSSTMDMSGDIYERGVIKAESAVIKSKKTRNSSS